MFGRDIIKFKYLYYNKNQQNNNIKKLGKL